MVHKKIQLYKEELLIVSNVQDLVSQREIAKQLSCDKHRNSNKQKPCTESAQRYSNCNKIRHNVQTCQIIKKTSKESLKKDLE